MRSGIAPAVSDVPRAVVSALGQRDVSAVDTKREVGGGIPGWSGSPAASWSVTWNRLPDSGDSPDPSPWRREAGFPPAPGTGVSVSVGSVEAGVHPVLTGVVDSSSASADGVVSSQVIDRVDALHRSVSVEPLVARMPPINTGEGYRLVGLQSDHVVHSVLRQCGFGATPVVPSGFVGVSVPAQGSMWPELGTVTQARAASGSGVTADFKPTTLHGWAAADARAVYTPSGAVRISQGLTLGFRVEPNADGNTVVLATFGGRSEQVRLTYSAGGTRAIYVQVLTGGSWQTIVAASGLSSSWDRAVAEVSSTSVRLVLSNNGQVVWDVSEVPSWPSGLTSATVDDVVVTAMPGARLNGVVAGRGMTAASYATQPQRVRSGGGTGFNPNMNASPAITGRDALEVLGEIAEATLRVFWWDEDGVFSWWPLDVLMARSPVATLTSEENLLDFPWEEALSDVYSRVVVSVEEPGQQRSTRNAIDLWQGNGETMDTDGEAREEFVNVPNDETWIMPQTAWSWLGLSGDTTEFNRGRGSWTGATLESTGSWAHEYLDESYVIPVTPETFKIRHKPASSSPLRQLVMKPPPPEVVSDVWTNRRDTGLPIIRGKCKVTWGKRESVFGSGPSAAADYQHDGGRWLQGYAGEGITGVGNFLASWVTEQRARVGPLPVIHDPRIQAGDKVRVRDEYAHGVIVEGLVTSIQQSTEAASQSMSLDLVVTNAQSLLFTLAEHDAQLAPGLFSSHQAARPTETMAEHTDAPEH